MFAHNARMCGSSIVAGCNSSHKARKLIPALLAGISAFGGIVSFSIVLYLQFAQHIAPCSLCIYQRVADLGLILLGVAGFWIRRKMLWALASLSAWVGASLAAWQWHFALVAKEHPIACKAIQLLPGTLPSLPGYSNNPLSAAFAGQGSCATAGEHRMMGWPITHWSLVFFVASGLALAVAAMMVKPKNR